MRSIRCARFACLGFLLACGVAVSGQTLKDNIVIFARAGHVNHLTGTSHVRQAFEGPAKPLAAGDELNVGDIVETGANTQMEVLLNPGSVIRMSENAQFQLISNPQQSIRFALLRGSAVIESVNGWNQLFSIQVITPSGMAFLEHYGIYRVNVRPDSSEFLAFDGSLMLGSRKVSIAAGERVTVSASGVSPVTTFAVKSQDSLDTWSHSRADVLAKANRKLDKRSLIAAMQGAMADQNLNAALQRQIGFWAKSNVHAFTVFVPFYSRWRSPYGYEHTNGTRPKIMADYRGPMPRGTIGGPRSSGRPTIWMPPTAPGRQSLPSQPPRPPGR